MLQALRENLLRYVEFTDEELGLLLSKFTAVAVKKNDVFLCEGEVCRSVAFVSKGLVRLYFLKDGKEHNSGFFQPGSWVSEYASFLHQKPSLFFIEALQDTELFALNYETMQSLYNRAKAFERLGRLIAENLYAVYVYRNLSLVLQSPEERYQTFVRENPGLLALLPQKQIASYVGIEPESLSRIRARLRHPARARKTR